MSTTNSSIEETFSLIDSNVHKTVENVSEIPSLKMIDVEPGTILHPGNYLIELSSYRLITIDNLLVALAMMGWGEVILDQSLPNHLSGHPQREQQEDFSMWSQEKNFSSQFRFIGKLEETIQIQENNIIHWSYVQNLNLDPFTDLKLKIFPYQLEKDGLYEIRFLSRMRSQPTRKALIETLNTMGWETTKLSALKKNMRLPHRPASVTLWYGLARWKGPMSYIVDEDPLYFEDVILIK